MSTRLTIGELASQAQVNIETLRYYERRGLLPAPPRSESNYRLYPDETVKVVRFIKRSQELGFSLREIEELLSLRTVSEAQCADVRRLAEAKIDDIDCKISALQGIRAALMELLAGCLKEAPIQECPIIEAIAAEKKL
jgi:MerR family mercuric resistance operon transcriptional regulator